MKKEILAILFVLFKALPCYADEGLVLLSAQSVRYSPCFRDYWRSSPLGDLKSLPVDYSPFHFLSIVKTEDGSDIKLTAEKRNGETKEMVYLIAYSFVNARKQLQWKTVCRRRGSTLDKIKKTHRNGVNFIVVEKNLSLQYQCPCFRKRINISLQPENQKDWLWSPLKKYKNLKFWKFKPFDGYRLELPNSPLNNIEFLRRNKTVKDNKAVIKKAFEELTKKVGYTQNCDKLNDFLEETFLLSAEWNDPEWDKTIKSSVVKLRQHMDLYCDRKVLAEFYFGTSSHPLSLSPLLVINFDRGSLTLSPHEKEDTKSYVYAAALQEDDFTPKWKQKPQYKSFKSHADIASFHTGWNLLSSILVEEKMKDRITIEDNNQYIQIRDNSTRDEKKKHINLYRDRKELPFSLFVLRMLAEHDRGRRGTDGFGQFKRSFFFHDKDYKEHLKEGKLCRDVLDFIPLFASLAPTYSDISSDVKMCCVRGGLCHEVYNFCQENLKSEEN